MVICTLLQIHRRLVTLINTILWSCWYPWWYVHYCKYIEDYSYINKHHTVELLVSMVICTLLRYFAKEVSSTSRSVCEGLQRLFARSVATNFKFCVRMGCVTIYYVTHTRIAYLLCQSPVHESVHEPFHARWISSWFVHFHASQTYALTYCIYSYRSLGVYSL